LYYIHTLGDQLENSIPITPTLYTGGDFEQLKGLIERGEIKQNQIRFFVGYSGWSENQLQEELNENSWFVAEGFEGLLMETANDDLWADIVKSLGKEYEHLANYPQDPNLN
jgi:putative transcriptional regulator